MYKLKFEEFLFFKNKWVILAILIVSKFRYQTSNLWYIKRHEYKKSIKAKGENVSEYKASLKEIGRRIQYLVLQLINNVLREKKVNKRFCLWNCYKVLDQEAAV